MPTMASRTPQEHLEWCIERAMRHYNDGRFHAAVNGFIYDVRRNPNTAFIAFQDDLASLTERLKEAWCTSRAEFERTLRSFAVSE